MSFRLAELVAALGGELQGDHAAERAINRVAPLDSAGPGDLSFLTHPKYRRQLAQCRATALIADRFHDAFRGAQIVTAQPYLYFARVAQLLSPPSPVAGAIHPTATIQGTVDASAYIGPHCVVAEGARVDAGAALLAGCYLGPGAVVGLGTRLGAQVVVQDSCIIGERGILHSGVVIGADGFGFARESDGRWVKIPQTGRVLIGNDVEIGANTTIDRGALEDTVIDDGVKLDNQIQVGHNVRIGAHTAMAGCVGIAGSAKIGARCTVGGGAIILGHLRIGDDVNISAGTLVAKSIEGPGTYSGAVPFLEHSGWLKNFAHLRHLESMADKIRALEARLADLEKKKS